MTSSTSCFQFDQLSDRWWILCYSFYKFQFVLYDHKQLKKCKHTLVRKSLYFDLLSLKLTHDADILERTERAYTSTCPAQTQLPSAHA
jgi:hypothetical protein